MMYVIIEAHHSTQIEGTHLTLEQSKHLWAGEDIPDADPDDIQELLNYRDISLIKSRQITTRITT